MSKNRVKINWLTINELHRTTKIITKMFGSSTYFSYLYFIINYKQLKPYGV